MNIYWENKIFETSRKSHNTTNSIQCWNSWKITSGLVVFGNFNGQIQKVKKKLVSLLFLLIKTIIMFKKRWTWLLFTAFSMALLLLLTTTTTIESKNCPMPSKHWFADMLFVAGFCCGFLHGHFC